MRLLGAMLPNTILNNGYRRCFSSVKGTIKFNRISFEDKTIQKCESLRD